MLSSQVSVASSWGSGSLELWKWRFNRCVAPRVCHRYFCNCCQMSSKNSIGFLMYSKWFQAPCDSSLCWCLRHGTISHAKAEKSLCGQQENGCKWQRFSVSIELSEVSQYARSYQEALWNSSAKCSLYFVLVPPNEKKSIQLLRDMPKSPPLNGMRLTLPRSSQEMKREVEMRPLATREQVTWSNQMQWVHIFIHNILCSFFLQYWLRLTSLFFWNWYLLR